MGLNFVQYFVLEIRTSTYSKYLFPLVYFAMCFHGLAGLVVCTNSADVNWVYSLIATFLATADGGAWGPESTQTDNDESGL